MEAAKADVKEYWEAAPCGTRDTRDLAEQEQHRELERIRDERESFIAEFAHFAETAGKRVLEVGVRAGTDHLRFARAGARLSEIDLTEAAIALTRRRFAMEGLTSDLRVGDAERLPFDGGSFDVVYSWGVITIRPTSRVRRARSCACSGPAGASA